MPKLVLILLMSMAVSLFTAFSISLADSVS